MTHTATLARATRSSVASVVLFGSAPALAERGVTVTDVWAKSTAPGQCVAAAYMNIVSHRPAALIRAESPVAKVVELHEVKLDGNVMKMRPVAKIEQPPGKTVKLEPGGLHVMLSDIRQPLKVDATVPLTLVVEAGGKTETLNVYADVMDAQGGGHRH